MADIGEARLLKEHSLARLRQLQAESLEGKLLNAGEIPAPPPVMAGPRERALGIPGTRAAVPRGRYMS